MCKTDRQYDPPNEYCNNQDILKVIAIKTQEGCDIRVSLGCDAFDQQAMAVARRYKESLDSVLIPGSLCFYIAIAPELDVGRCLLSADQNIQLASGVEKSTGARLSDLDCILVLGAHMIEAASNMSDQEINELVAMDVAEHINRIWPDQSSDEDENSEHLGWASVAGVIMYSHRDLRTASFITPTNDNGGRTDILDRMCYRALTAMTGKEEDEYSLMDFADAHPEAILALDKIAERCRSGKHMITLPAYAEQIVASSKVVFRGSEAQQNSERAP